MLSVAAVHDRSTWNGLAALAARPLGAVGGTVSPATGSRMLVLPFSPLASVAVSMISYEYVPIVPWLSATKLPCAPLPPTNVWTWLLWCRSTVHDSADVGSAP